MRTRPFGPTGVEVPVVGQGTWPTPNVEALRRGIELGMTHIDTAEMYGSGRSEDLVAEAIAPYDRATLFLVSKVVPSNATPASMRRACENSLRRLKTDYLDSYLLHWRGGDLAEAMHGLEELVDEGKILSLGVSNLDPWDLREASAGLDHAPIACNQIYYNLAQRTPDDHEIPWCAEHGAAFVAYTPLSRPRSKDGERVLGEIAQRHGVSKEAVSLAALLREPFSFVIPKANQIAHVEANAAAGDLELDATELAAIDAAYPTPERNGSLPTN